MDFKKYAPLFCPMVAFATALLLTGLAGCSKSPEEVKAEAAKHEAATTGRLLVKSNRPEATVEAVAGAHNAKGNVDQVLSALPPGKYAVTLHVDGWPDAKGEATVAVGTQAEVTINFKSGSLRLDSDPPGAVVTLAGATLGKTPLVIPQLPAGECTLALTYPNWPAVTYKAIIKEGAESAETVRLPHGKLTVESTPSGATVLLGGRAYGQTPLLFERVTAGTKKITLQGKDFPPLELSVKVDDRADVKINPELGSGFPELDPSALLQAVWVPDDPSKLAVGLDALGKFESRNGVIKNLHRKRLYETYLRKSYRHTAIVKSYDPQKGRVEFADQENSVTKYRVVADLSITARSDKDLAAKLAAKGATVTLYGRLEAVEEPRWPGKVITLELAGAEPLH